MTRLTHPRLTHLDASGAAHMVDVGGKAVTERTAIAEGRVLTRPETVALIRAGDARKGDVLGVARIAGIQAAKRTYETTDLRARLSRHHADPDSAFRGWNDIWLHPDFRRWNIEEYLAGIAVPLLLIQGEDDQYGTVAQVEAIARQVAGPVETVILPDCTHSPHQAQKDSTIAAIAQFVRNLIF
jgi:pimeloyl-ACP methyl ester carboxylesterase